MFHFITRKRLIIFTCLLAIAAVAVGAISYLTLRKLTFGSAADSDQVRVEANKRALHIAEKLLERGAQPVAFNAQEGFELRGYFLPGTMPECNVVLCHGYRGNKETLYKFVDLFPPANILFFDFRAHGQSGGDYISIGFHEYKDVISAAKFMRKKVKGTKSQDLPLVILGISMGGASTVKAAALQPDLCDALIIDSSYADLWEVIHGAFSQHTGLPTFPFIPVMNAMVRYLIGADLPSMRPVEYVKTITTPIFFVHSCIDEHTAPNDTLRMYAHAKSTKKKLWIGPKTDHAKLHKFCDEKYKRKIKVFLDHYLHNS